MIFARFRNDPEALDTGFVVDRRGAYHFAAEKGPFEIDSCQNLFLRSGLLAASLDGRENHNGRASRLRSRLLFRRLLLSLVLPQLLRRVLTIIVGNDVCLVG